MAERSTHLAGGLARLRERLRVDQVAHRFSLREIEPARQKCTLRKFSRLGQPRAERQRAAQQKLQNHRRAVRSNLYQIFRRVGVWRGKKSDQRLIDRVGWGRVDSGGAASAQSAVEHVCQSRASVFERLMRPDELRGDGRGLRPAQAHNPYAAPPGRRGDSGDGVGWRSHSMHSV